MVQNQNIRIRLKAFDHRVLDQSAGEIVKTKAWLMTPKWRSAVTVSSASAGDLKRSARRPGR